MKVKNTIVELLLCFFVPFYIFYWLYDTERGLRHNNVPHVPSIKPLLWVAIGFFATIILSVITFFLVPLFAVLGAAAGGEVGGTTGILGGGFFLIVTFGLSALQFPLSIAYLILFVMYVINFSKAVSSVYKLDVDSTVLTLLFIFIAPLSVYFVQEAINKTAHPAPTQ